MTSETRHGILRSPLVIVFKVTVYFRLSEKYVSSLRKNVTGYQNV